MIPDNFEITDEEHNLEIDRSDAIRFRRLVKAGLNNEIWFLRMAKRHTNQPSTLQEVRELMDYVIRVERL